MKKKLSLLSIGFVILITACKKDKVEPSTDNPPTDLVVGYLINFQNQFIEDDSIQSIIYSGSASFSFSMPPTNFVTVDTVLLNDTYLPLNGFGYYEGDIDSSSSCDWHVKGNNGIPDFDYTDKMGMPTYSGYKSLPDSIDRFQSLTIPITGASNAIHMSITISDNFNKTISRDFKITDSQVTFSVAELSTLQGNQWAYIHVILVNEHTQQLGGKLFKFENETELTKSIVIY